MSTFLRGFGLARRGGLGATASRRLTPSGGARGLLSQAGQLTRADDCANMYKACSKRRMYDESVLLVGADAGTLPLPWVVRRAGVSLCDSGWARSPPECDTLVAAPPSTAVHAMPDNEERLTNSLGFKHGDEYESVRRYDETRFRSSRMRRLDAREKRFAQVAFELVGAEAAILDVPCGNGRFFEIFSQGKQLTMADYSENMLKACQEKYNPCERVRLIRADIAALPLSDASVDLAFCMRLFHHMATDAMRRAALSELARVSRRYVALSFYNRCSWRYLKMTLWRGKAGHTSISARHLMSLAEESRLSLVYRLPRFNLVEQQCMMIFEKR